MKLDDTTWRDLGEVEAFGVANARKAAVEEHDLDSQIREGITLIAVGARFWTPKTSTVKVNETVSFD